MSNSATWRTPTARMASRICQGWRTKFMADPMRLWRQAQLRALVAGCQALERADGQGAASSVRSGNCSWAEYFDPTGSQCLALASRHADGYDSPLMNEITGILNAIEQGDPRAASQLLPLVYDELRKLAARKLAQEAPGQTLQPTALVHEAYLRLVGDGQEQRWDHRGHFFAACAEAMRRILVDNARRRAAQKRGGDARRVEWNDLFALAEVPDDDLLALDEALR